MLGAILIIIALLVVVPVGVLISGGRARRHHRLLRPEGRRPAQRGFRAHRPQRLSHPLVFEHWSSRRRALPLPRLVRVGQNGVPCPNAHSATPPMIATASSPTANSTSSGSPRANADVVGIAAGEFERLNGKVLAVRGVTPNVVPTRCGRIAGGAERCARVRVGGAGARPARVPRSRRGHAERAPGGALLHSGHRDPAHGSLVRRARDGHRRAPAHHARPDARRPHARHP